MGKCVSPHFNNPYFSHMFFNLLCPKWVRVFFFFFSERIFNYYLANSFWENNIMIVYLFLLMPQILVYKQCRRLRRSFEIIIITLVLI